MSGDRLVVDLDGLEAFAGNLDSIRSRMNGTRSLVDGYAGDLGSAEVEGALDDFESNWSDGRKKIDENAGRLATMAREAAKGLRQADDDLAQGIEDAAVRSGPTPGGGGRGPQ